MSDLGHNLAKIWRRAFMIQGFFAGLNVILLVVFAATGLLTAFNLLNVAAAAFCGYLAYSAYQKMTRYPTMTNEELYREIL